MMLRNGMSFFSEVSLNGTNNLIATSEKDGNGTAKENHLFFW
jgi:hypothetical protein